MVQVADYATKYEEKVAGASEDDDLKPKEVRTHSSILTNRRIAELLTIRSHAGVEALSNPGEYNLAIKYFAATQVLFMDTLPLFETKQNAKLLTESMQLLDDGEQLSTYLRVYGKNANINHGIILNTICKRLHMNMIMAYSNVQYLFKYDITGPRTIEEKIAQFKTKSIYGGSKVTELSTIFNKYSKELKEYNKQNESNRP